MRRSATLAACAAVLCLALSACQAGGDASGTPNPTEAPASPGASPSLSVSPGPSAPGPSASPGPSVDPSQAAVAERAAEAERRYREYLAIRERNHTNGNGAFQELHDKGYLGHPDIWTSEELSDELIVTEKVRQVGQVQVRSIEVTGYDGDPLADDIFGHRVNLSVCLDHSDHDLVRADGESVVPPGQPDRVVMHLVMQGQEAGRWTVNKHEPTGKEC